jgi:hypothetical protein
MFISPHLMQAECKFSSSRKEKPIKSISVLHLSIHKANYLGFQVYTRVTVKSTVLGVVKKRPNVSEEYIAPTFSIYE